MTVARHSVWKCSWVLVWVLCAGCSRNPTPEQGAGAKATETTPVAAAQPEPTSPAGEEQAGTLPPQELARRNVAAAENLLKQGKANLALQLLNEAIQADPQAAVAYSRRAEILAAANFKTQAIQDLTQAIALRPDDPQLYNTRGYLRMSREDLTGAMEDFSQAIALDLKYPQPYNNRGLIRVSQGDPQTALKDFETALEIDPNYIDAHNNQGYALYLLKRYDEAVAALTRAIDQDASYINAWNNRGLAHKEAGRLEEAVRDFSKAIELQPAHTKYYLHRREVLEKLGRSEEARADFERVAWLEDLAVINRRVAAQPQDYRVWLDRAEHLLQGKRYEPALDDARRAIELASAGSPERTAGYVVLARIQTALGQFEQAIETATAGVQNRADDLAYSVRGEAHFQLGHYAAAIDDFKQARRLDPLVQQAYERQAQALEAAGQVQQASLFREQAAALAPERLIQTVAHDSVEPPPFPGESAAPRKP